MNFNEVIKQLKIKGKSQTNNQNYKIYSLEGKHVFYEGREVKDLEINKNWKDQATVELMKGSRRNRVFDEQK